MSSSQDAEKQRAGLDWAQEGLRLLSAGDYEGAVAACAEAIKLDARSMGAYRTRAQAYQRLGMGKEAVADYKHLGVEMAPESVARERRPWLAMLLNVLPLPVGLGYLYLGRPGRCLLTFFGAVAAVVVGWVLAVFIWISVHSDCYEEGYPLNIDCVGDDELLLLNFVPPLLWITLWMSLAFFTARDAWRIAEGTQVLNRPGIMGPPGVSRNPDDNRRGPVGAIAGAVVGVFIGAIVGAPFGAIGGGIFVGAIVGGVAGTIVDGVRRS